ncbi:MAG: hypothetical protein FWC95_05865 [Defluviitaleaceae bacterium]|nr:hypothetical protein [Defluviitaleaceae bacterium]
MKKQRNIFVSILLVVAALVIAGSSVYFVVVTNRPAEARDNTRNNVSCYINAEPNS